MPKFRKKPIEIEAVRHTGDRDAVLQWTGLTATNASTIYWKDGKIVIRTLEGDMVAEIGDWIIRGVAGEVYPCKPDIFAATYEPM